MVELSAEDPLAAASSRSEANDTGRFKALPERDGGYQCRPQ
jgi:hypothetical protein